MSENSDRPARLVIEGVAHIEGVRVTRDAVYLYPGSSITVAPIPNATVAPEPNATVDVVQIGGSYIAPSEWTAVSIPFGSGNTFGPDA